VLPRCNTEATALHLAAISAEVAPGRHAALLVDQAGWHTSAKLAVPDNITLVPLPAKCPELVWGRLCQALSIGAPHVRSAVLGVRVNACATI
jgi:hypothetical protein